MLLLVYIFIWSLFLLFTGNIKKTPVFTALGLFYLIGMITAFIMYNYTDSFSDDSNQLYIVAIIYHLFYLMMFFYPIKTIELRMNPASMYVMNYNNLKLFLYPLIVFSIISIVSSILILYGLKGTALLEMRSTVMLEGEGRELKYSGGILAHITSFASEYSFISLFFAFYCAVCYPNKQKIVYLLLFSCLSYLFYNLEIGGREAVVRYVFDFIFVYYLFSRFLNQQWKRRIKRISVCLFIGSFGVFLFITLARFVFEIDGSGSDFLSGTLGYYSQGFVHFSKFFHFFSHTSNDGRNLFAGFIPGYEASTIIYDTSVPFATNVFSTFVGTMISNLGMYRSLIPLFVAILFMTVVSKMNRNTVFYYIYAFWFMRFIFSGIFYWIGGFRTFAIVAYMLIFFLLHLCYYLFHYHKPKPGNIESLLVT